MTDVSKVSETDRSGLADSGENTETWELTVTFASDGFTGYTASVSVDIPGESMSLGDIDRAMEGLGQQFNELLRKAADANNADSYTAQFQSISTALAELKRRKAKILQIRQEQEQTNRRVQAVASVLKTASSELTEWDDNVIYQLLEKVTVLSRERIRVTLRDGLEIEQAVEQPKRRKFT